MSGSPISRDLFSRLRREGWPVVDEWTAAQEPETNHLEFKNKHDPARSDIAPEDIDELAKSLSAFANTAGGLIVFGIDAGAGGKRGAGFDRVKGGCAGFCYARFGT